MHKLVQLDKNEIIFLLSCYFAGTMVGVAFGTFVLGIVIGAFSFYVLNRYQTCQLATHYFYKRKRGHASTTDNKEGRAIEMDFTKLDET